MVLPDAWVPATRALIPLLRVLVVYDGSVMVDSVALDTDSLERSGKATLG